MEQKKKAPNNAKPASENKKPAPEIIKPTPTCPEEEAYLKYIDEHRRLVYNAFKQHGQKICLSLSLLGLPYHKLRNRIFVHDVSKYGTEEFNAYRMTFYPKKEEESPSDFGKAWKHHYTVNDHHWEHWIENGKPKEMDKIAVAEMLLDWEAMSVKFKNSPVDWYQKNRDKIILERRTRELIEKTLAMLKMTMEYPYTVRRSRRRTKK